VSPNQEHVLRLRPRLIQIGFILITFAAFQVIPVIVAVIISSLSKV
jgi:hypothetical protein